MVYGKVFVVTCLLSQPAVTDINYGQCTSGFTKTFLNESRLPLVFITAQRLLLLFNVKCFSLFRSEFISTPYPVCFVSRYSYYLKFKNINALLLYVII